MAKTSRFIPPRRLVTIRQWGRFLNFRRIPSRIYDSLKYYFKGLLKLVTENDIFVWAGAIAFKVLVAFIPLVILLTGLFGLFLRQDDPFIIVLDFIEQFLPEYESAQAVDFMYALARAGNTITIIGIAGILVMVITLFSTIRSVISQIFHKYDPRSILGGYVFDIRMAAQVSLLFLLSLALTLFITTITSAGVEVIQALNLDFAWVLRGWHSLLRLLLYILPFALTLAMFFQLIYFIPRPHPPVTSALLGASITAILWELAKTGFTFYATYLARFDRYGATTDIGEGSIGPLGNIFGLIIALVFWVFYSGVVLIIGAMIALLHQRRSLERKRERRRETQTAAAAAV